MMNKLLTFESFSKDWEREVSEMKAKMEARQMELLSGVKSEIEPYVLELIDEFDQDGKCSFGIFDESDGGGVNAGDFYFSWEVSLNINDFEKFLSLGNKLTRDILENFDLKVEFSTNISDYTYKSINQLSRIWRNRRNELIRDYYEVSVEIWMGKNEVKE
jgi:aspartate/tyrosine/aromatic aminotransferase